MPTAATTPVAASPYIYAAPAPIVAPAPPAAIAVPPARRRPKRAEALTVAQQRVSPTDEIAFATIEAELGGRQRLAAMLAAAQFPVAEAQVVGLIADPRNDGETLAKVCALGGVSLARLLKMFREATLTRGQMLAMDRVAQRLPDVAAAVMEDAIPGNRPCEACQGLGVVAAATAEDPAANQACGLCRGTGLVRHIPDHGVQKTALQLGGLLKKGGDSSIAAIIAPGGVGGAVGTGGFDQLVSALDVAIYGAGRERFRRRDGAADPAGSTVDGELVEGEGDQP